MKKHISKSRDTVPLTKTHSHAFFFVAAISAARAQSCSSRCGTRDRRSANPTHSWGSASVSILACAVEKKISDFPVPSRDVTNQTLSGREKFCYSPPGRVCLVTSRLGWENSPSFLQCGTGINREHHRVLLSHEQEYNGLAAS
jgi:hypothetical protein